MADNLEGIPFSSDDEGIDFPHFAKTLVQEQINVAGIGTRKGDPIVEIGLSEIYVVWFAYILGNWKAILSTSRPDGRIWEVTHSRQKMETYVDSYLKTHNVAVQGGEAPFAKEVIEEPTEPGFYYGKGSSNWMIYLLDVYGQWHAVLGNGDTQSCDWGYIEQSTQAYPLVRVEG